MDYDTTDASDAGEKRSSRKSTTNTQEANTNPRDTGSQVRYPDPFTGDDQ